MQAMAYDIYISADFSNGLFPEGFSLYDEDGLEQSPDNASYGFSDRDSWIIGRFQGEKEFCAAATSYFTVPGTASNWMVTDGFKVDSPNASLEWTARSANGNMPDGYSIYISTSGNTPADFTGAPLMSVAREDADWTRHRLSLAQYEGSEIWVAFVHDSHDCDRLLLSDIFAGVPASAYLLCDTPAIIGTCDPLDVSAQVFTHNESPVKGFSVELTANGTTVRQDFPETVLNPGVMYPVTFPEAIIPVENVTMDYTLRVIADEDSYELASSVTALPVRVMCEELTGTWCGFCVCGIVELEKMRTDFPDTFVAAAVHVNDVMTSEWTSRVSQFIGSGLPTMVMNHDVLSSGHPSKIRNFYLSLMNRAPVASVKVDSRYDAASRMVEVSTLLKFAEETDGSLYRIHYGIIENDVYHPENSDYLQSNAYSGGDQGEMAGWEELGPKVHGVHFNEVARQYVDDSPALPGIIKPFEDVVHNISIAVTETLENPENAEVIAMLIDAEDRIVNVAKTPLMGSDTGISAIEADSPVIRNGVIAWNGTGHLRLYSIDGRLIATSTGGIMRVDGLHGAFILLAGDKSEKILL